MRTTSLAFVLLVLIVSATAESAIGESAKIVTLAGNGRETYSGDGGPAREAGLGQPFGLTIGPDAALYVCSVSNHVVRRIDLNNRSISTVAGTGEKGYSGDGGPATAARLNEPYEIRFDADGNMFFVEMQNNVVRRVDARTKRISTVAGTGKKGFSGDGGPAIEAQLNQPHSIALDQAGNLYICDIGNNRIRRVDLTTGLIATFSGTGERKPTRNGSPISGAPLNGPRTLDFDGHGAFFLALREGNACYRLDLHEGRIHHVAGNGKKGYDGDGADARIARLNGPKGIAVGPGGTLYLADTENHVIRTIRNGTITTIVGDGQSGDGPNGDPLRCRLNRPHGVFVDNRGSLYISDSSNHRVRLLRAD